MRLPAVDHHRPGVRGGGGLDPAQEGQQAGGMVRHAMLRPRGEVELAHLMFGRVASLQETIRQMQRDAYHHMKGPAWTSATNRDQLSRQVRKLKLNWDMRDGVTDVHDFLACRHRAEAASRGFR